MADERRQSQRFAVQMTAELLLTGRGGEAEGDPVKVQLADLTVGGVSLFLKSMHTSEGKHLFYTVQDREEYNLVLRFVDSKGRRYQLTCAPVWFNKELDEEPFYYRLGLSFLNSGEKEQIKLLNKIARGREQKGFVETVGNFFKKQQIRVS